MLVESDRRPDGGVPCAVFLGAVGADLEDEADPAARGWVVVSSRQGHTSSQHQEHIWADIAGRTSALAVPTESALIGPAVLDADATPLGVIGPEMRRLIERAHDGQMTRRSVDPRPRCGNGH
jgi:hypothetical protein